MSENEKRLLVPQLRFPEFQEDSEWLAPTLGDVSEPVNERVGDRKLIPISISAGIGFVPQSEKFGRDISGNQYKLYTVVRDGDFVYNKGNSLKFPQGCVYDLQGWGEVAAPNVFICFRLKDGYENGFYRQCFEKNAHGIQLRKHITSGARSNGLLNISKEAFYGVKIPTPKVAEQKKIADCLSSLDNLLTAEVQKLDTLKKYKQGLMQQLFPREGESVPRLRFPEFQSEGEWVYEKIGDCLEKVIDYRGKAPPKAESGVQLITAKNVRFGWLDMSCNEYISADEYESWMSKGIPRGGDILFTTEAPLGNVAFFPCTGKFALGQRIITLRTKPKKCLAEFLFQALLTPDMQKKIDLHSTGSTAKGIKSKVFVSLSFCYPKISEQQKIAEVLSSLDNFIAAQSQKLDVLKNHKKGLMQQLFPVFDEILA
ncbi:TPA: restriction endonuclease subunit S [Klebsiella pneumoniae]|nr:restriction endonuclease subunit S [Klebsiella pneumoniae]